MKRFSSCFLLLTTLLLTISTAKTVDARESYTFRNEEYAFGRCDGSISIEPIKEDNGIEKVGFRNITYNTYGEVLTTCFLLLQYYPSDLESSNSTWKQEHDEIVERSIANTAPIIDVLVNEYSTTDKTSYIKIHRLNSFYYGFFFHKFDDELYVAIRVESYNSDYIDNAMEFLLENITRNGERLWNTSFPY